MSTEQCRVDGCTKPIFRKARRLCTTHNTRWVRHGDVEHLGRATGTFVEGKDARTAKAEWVVQYKMERGCTDCGYAEHPAALDFDHRPGTVKIRDIKSGQHFGWAALLAEVEKCDVVCANCHRIRTVTRAREEVR